jgi:3-hydroxyisobutyrate dehydrogenase-like beta-hydroxyacid dehydrogenase
VAEVGLIGVGLVGTALAERFVAARLSLIGYDCRPEARAGLQSIGGAVADSAVGVAESSPVVVLSLPDSDAVETVIGEIELPLAGRTVVDTTTGDPDRTAALGERLKARGVDYLDATIVGSSRLVREGQAVVVVGGEVAVFRRCAALFDTFTAHEFHVGPWGSGARMKLVVNLVLGLNRAVLAEGLVFAGALGFDPAVALDVLRSGAAYSRVMDTKGRRMVAGDFTPEARLRQHHKDVALILAAAERAELELPLSRVHDGLLAAAEGQGFGELDNSAIIRAFGRPAEGR